MLERDSRPCFWAMFRSYETLLHHLESSRFNVFVKRHRLKSTYKVKILGQALGKRVFS
jgi:phytoene/squalene synthetase